MKVRCITVSPAARATRSPVAAAWPSLRRRPGTVRRRLPVPCTRPSACGRFPVRP